VGGNLKIFKYNDYNGNGVWELGEPALAGFRFGVVGPVNFSVVSDEHGEVFLFGIPYGSYVVREALSDGWESTTVNPQTVVLVSEDLVEVRFGNRQVPVTTTTSTTVSTTTTQPDCSRVVVSARGVEAAGVKPVMQLWIDGRMRAQWSVLSDVREYVYASNLCGGGHNVDVVYTNDCSTPTVNRDLYVYYVKAGGYVIESDESGVGYDRGTGSAAFDGIDVVDGRVRMDSNGALHFTVNGGLSTTTTTSPVTTTTAPSGVCSLKGDYAPCGVVTIGEVVDLINMWVADKADISEVIDLIYAYRDSP